MRTLNPTPTKKLRAWAWRKPLFRLKLSLGLGEKKTFALNTSFFA
jgi:hypothetical protein